MVAVVQIPISELKLLRKMAQDIQLLSLTFKTKSLYEKKRVSECRPCEDQIRLSSTCSVILLIRDLDKLSKKGNRHADEDESPAHALVLDGVR